MQRKVKALTVKQKSFELEQKGGKCFQGITAKGDKWAMLLCVGVENQAADLNFGKKTALWIRAGLFESRLTLTQG